MTRPTYGAEPRAAFPEFRQLCDDGYPPDIANNLDVIFRVGLRPATSVDAARPIDQMKQLFESRLLLEYVFIRHGWRPSALASASRRGTATPVLALLYPYRADYHAFLFPVTNLLADRGVRTSVLSCRQRFRPHADPALFRGASFLFEEDFYSLDAYRRARRRYSSQSPWLRRLSSQLHLSREQDRSLRVFYQTLCIQREAFTRILHAVQPSLVFGLHFILNPGFLSAIDQIPAEKERPFKLLIQHGYFRSGAFHDFKGADCALLWGPYSESVLRSCDSLPLPASRIVGNPKLESEIASGGQRARRSVWTQTDSLRKEILFVSTADAPASEYHSQAARLLAKAMQACPSSWNALYRPHPSEPAEHYCRLVEDGLISPGQIVPQSSAIYELLRHADVVCGGNSTALLEAAALGAPAIQILPGMSGTDWVREGMTGVSTEQELLNALRGVLTDPQYQQQVLASQQRLAERMFSPTVGSAQNIADYIMELVGKDSETRRRGLTGCPASDVCRRPC